MDYTNYTAGPEENGTGGYRRNFLIGAIAVLCVVLVISVIFLISMGVREQKYNSAIKSGNQYFNAGDYQNAIQQYQLAVAVDRKKDAGYLNMASAYINLGDYNSAAAVLNDGLLHGGSSALGDRLQALESDPDAFIAANLTEEQILTYSLEATVENTIFDIVAAYTYRDYHREYGNSATTSSASGQVVVRTADGMSMFYYDLPNEKVLDAAGNAPVETAKPCYVTVRDLKSIFSCKADGFAVSFARLGELFGDVDLKYDEAQGRYYVVAKYKNCLLSVQTDAQGNIVAENAWNKMEPLSRKGLDESGEVDGKVSGYVQDAVTGRGMKATIKIRKRGSKTGSAIDELTSGTDGSYTYGGAQGLYTAEVSAKGYVTEYLDIEIVRGQVKSGKNVVLSPTVGDGEIRIVLTWGSSPTDLDSHAQGKSSSGSNFHISYQNKSVSNVGTLDVDDTNGYGPETITIKDSGANFTYSVVDYTQSGRMSSSGATVKVYLPGKSPITYTVPSGSGNTWTVFKYQNGTVTPVNTIG